MVTNAGSQSLCLLLARAVIGVEQVLNHAAHNSTQAPLVAQQVLYMGKGSLCSHPEDHSHSTLNPAQHPCPVGRYLPQGRTCHESEACHNKLVGERGDAGSQDDLHHAAGLTQRCLPDPRQHRGCVCSLSSIKFACVVVLVTAFLVKVVTCDGNAMLFLPQRLCIDRACPGQSCHLRWERSMGTPKAL